MVENRKVMVWVAVRNVVALLEASWRQLLLTELISLRGKQTAKHASGSFQEEILAVHAWVLLSHRQGSGERCFVSSSFPFLLPTHLPPPLQCRNVSCCCENICPHEQIKHI